MSNADSKDSDIWIDFCQLSYDNSTSTDEGYHSMIRCTVNSQVESLQEQLRLSEEGENEHYVFDRRLYIVQIRLQGNC